MSQNSNSFKSRFLVLIGFSATGLLFIIGGTYLWLPLIFIGMLLIFLGFFLSDNFWF